MIFPSLLAYQFNSTFSKLMQKLAFHFLFFILIMFPISSLSLSLCFANDTADVVVVAAAILL